MSFGTQDDSDEVMNEINMTPLVDVMLVLLIIFIITVPVMKDSVNIDLPRASNEPELIKPETINLSISADGQYHWNKESVSDDELARRLHAEGGKENQPDRSARFRIRRIVWQVVSKGEGLSVMSGPDSSRNIQLFGSDIVP